MCQILNRRRNAENEFSVLLPSQAGASKDGWSPQISPSKNQLRKIDLRIPVAEMVPIIDAAQPPKLPVSPNRFLGAGLLAIGLFSTVSGYLMLKSARRPV